MFPRFILLTYLILLPSLTVMSAQTGQNPTLNPVLIADSERAVVRSQEDLAKAQSLMKQAMEIRLEKI